MSAFIVTDDHINALVAYAVREQIYFSPLPNAACVKIYDLNAPEIGRLLMDENVASVNHRYQGRIDEDEKNAAAAYTYADFPRALTHIEAIKAAHCLDYQSCEHDGWDNCTAQRILKAIVYHASARLPGYDAAPWAIDRNAWDRRRAG